MTELWITAGLAVLSGVLGRMGGAQGYNTNYRDVGCPTVFLGAVIVVFGFEPAVWWAYALTWILMFGSLRTYWQFLFKGVDNMFMSGIMVGVAAFPLGLISPWLAVIVALRAVFLCLWWGLLNRHLPKKGVLIWRRDVAEEFLRYSLTF